MNESWIIVRDKKPTFPGWQKDRKYRYAKDENERLMYTTFKIHEESKEVMQAHSDNNRDEVLEELCDVYETLLCLDKPRDLFCMYQPNIQSIVSHYGFSEADIAAAADQKRATHGSFLEGILLDSNTVKK